MELLLVVDEELDVGVLAARGLHVLDFQLLDLLHARGGLARLRLVGAEAAHKVFEVGDAVLGARVGVLLLLARERGRFHVVVVISRIHAEAAVVQVRHVAAHARKEMPVVRDDHHGARAPVEHVLQPADALDVEVIGRLVQQQDLRLAEEGLREQHAQLPAGRDRAHRAVVLRDRHAQAEQQLARARLRGVAAVFGILRLQVRRAQELLFACLRVGVDRVALAHRVPHLGVAHQHYVENPLVLVGELVLAQLADALVAVDRHRARGGFETAAEDLHEGRLAAAVGADQAIAIPAAEFDGHVLEQGLGPELHGDAGGDDHGESRKQKAGRSQLWVKAQERGRIILRWQTAFHNYRQALPLLGTGMPQPLDDDRTVASEGVHRGTGSTLSGNALPAGTHLHEFEIIDLIGEGGFGIVYLARDCVLERKVALKEYLPSALASRGPGMTVVPTSSGSSETFQIGLRSFVNEGRMLAQFDHPALVKVYRFWEANGTAYMVMPYYQGITLKAALQSAETPPDEVGIKKLLAHLLDALEVLHRANALHRDIAPDNILMLPDGNPVLLDFGAARRVITDRTQNFTAILKPGYAPIEQYAESPSMKQGPWTDLYALAGVVYFAITGEKPTPAVARTIADPLVPFEKAGSGRYSPEFLRALDRALAVKPDDRPQSVAEFRSLLELDRVQSVTRKTQLPERPAAGAWGLRPGLVFGVAVALMVAIGAAALLKWGKATPPATIATPSAPAVPAAPPGPPDVPPAEQKPKEEVASSVVPEPPKQ